MKFAQDFHLAVNFTNDNAVFEFFVRMKILTVVLNPFRDEERELAPGAVRAEGGDAKEGRKHVRHGRSGWIVESRELVKQLTIQNKIVVYGCTKLLTN